MNNINSFEQEWERTLNTIVNRNKTLISLDYFIQLAKDNILINKIKSDKPKVVMIGYLFPEEIIRALNIDFCYVFGGSYQSTKFDNNLPKDTDDTALSIFGLLNGDCIVLNNEDIILFPLYNDDMKKMCSLLENKATVIPYEVPSYKEDKLQEKRYVYEIQRVTKELEKHFNKKLSIKTLKKECALSKKATEFFNRFEDLFKERNVISSSAFMLIANSYHFCKNKDEWTNNINNLINEINNTDNVFKHKNNIMVFGSPIYAPEYKPIFSLEDLNLKIYTIIHPDIAHIKYGKYYELDSISIENLSKKYLELDISPTFINNNRTYYIVDKTIKKRIIDGVIAFVLRDQIEYDYQFNYIERLIVDNKVPLNRIETVYGNDDIEHLKLRLDAFFEMINIKK